MTALTHAHAEAESPLRVVVLGGGGFIGRHLVDGFVSANIDVVALGSRDPDLAEASAATELAKRLRDGDVLVFLAALTPDKGRGSGALLRNLAMGRAVCEAARRVRLAQLVYASSDAVYPFATGTITEETPAAPSDLYGAMHRTREIMLAAEAPAPLAVLRLTAVYGSGDTHNAYGPNRFVRQALRERRIALFGAGEETRDHLHIRDVVRLSIGIVTHRSQGVLNVASGHSMTFHALAELVAACTGTPVSIETSVRQNPVTHRRFDITNLVRAFPAFELTSPRQGLTEMAAEMRTEIGG